MKLTNETLSTVAKIKTEASGRVFFEVGQNVLSYCYFNNQHIVAFVGRFWKSGVLDSVGDRMTFNNQEDALAFIKEKYTYLNSKAL